MGQSVLKGLSHARTCAYRMRQMLDALDSAILNELQSNARQSFRKLAEKFEASSATVAERVRKMEKQGMIKGLLCDAEPREA